MKLIKSLALIVGVFSLGLAFSSQTQAHAADYYKF